jgi:hypothetical protein
MPAALEGEKSKTKGVCHDRSRDSYRDHPLSVVLEGESIGLGCPSRMVSSANRLITSIPAEIEATITFSLVLNNGATAAQPVATSAFLLSNNIGSPGAITYIQTEAILTVALQGGLRLQGSDPSGPSGVNRLSN